MTTKNSVNDLTREIINEIALEFIVNEKSTKDLMDKYNLSKNSILAIIERGNLVQKRDKYREKVLDRSLERCANYQSKIIFKATELLHEHVEKLSQRARKNANSILSSAEIRDVMAILSIISKEHRLDNDKPTDRTIKTVDVQFPEGFIPITRKPDVIVDADFKDVPKQENEESIRETEHEENSETKQESSETNEEEVVVEIDDDILGSPLG